MVSWQFARRLASVGCEESVAKFDLRAKREGQTRHLRPGMLAVAMAPRMLVSACTFCNL
jgi:hypothetical protein